jgi:hypothetical protein
MTDYCTLGIQFSTEDRGRTAFQWRLTRELATLLLDEMRDRIGPPHQESFVEAALIDEVTREFFGRPGIVWMNNNPDDEAAQ